MDLNGRRVFEQQDETAREKRAEAGRRQAGNRLRAIAAVLLTLAAGSPSGFAQQAGAGATAPEKQASELPSAPAPVLTQPLNLRSSARDFTKPAGRLLGNPINMYRPTTIAKASFANSVRLTDLVKDGKIYLSLSDAIALALENNYDIAIARYDLDIADTDILRTRTGAGPLGAPSGLVTGTLGGSTSTLTAGGGPGGTSVGSGGAGSGTAGLSLTTQRRRSPAGGPGALRYGGLDVRSRPVPPSSSFFTGGTSTTNTYNFTYNQGFVTGTAFQFAFDNTQVYNSTNTVTTYQPAV